MDRCAKEYPTIHIIGSHHGYYSSGEEHLLIDEIASKNPDILFLALGLPQKEYFVNDHGKKLNASVILPVGGGFDVYSGEKKRHLIGSKIWGSNGCGDQFTTVQEEGSFISIFYLSSRSCWEKCLNRKS